MSSNARLHTYTMHHVAKLLQHLYTLKIVNFGNIYNCNTKTYLKITVSIAGSN